MLTIEVKRHAQGLAYFEPWIEEHDDGSGDCTFHFHWDDIREEGVGMLADAITQQVQRLWRPRPLGAPAGRRIPVIMRRCPVMEGRDIITVFDLPEGVLYEVPANLISARGAALITREQSKLTPRWRRISRCRQPQTV